MEKFFNTAGPIKTDLHYYVDSRERWDFEQVLRLIAQQKYFVLHAPRQTGKTTALLALVDYLNDSGAYDAIYANIEASQVARDDVARGIRAVLVEIASSMDFFLKDSFLQESWPDIFESVGPEKALTELLVSWAKKANKPTVLFLDEVDALVGDTLISLLRQIRSGYNKRPTDFPISIILCGVRDVRDYRIHSSKTKEIITGGSAFNIKAESLLLDNFTKAQIERLYQQHSAATGQAFEEGVIDLAWYYTRGQPWLVNALAYEVTFNIKAYQDRSQMITNEAFQQAKEQLILRRDTHLDQLVDKLQEERVKNVIAPLLSGDTQVDYIKDMDLQYVVDLGLVRKGMGETVEISNAIYKEIIPRELTYTTQQIMRQQSTWYLRPNGSLDMDKLLTAFQAFFRQHSEHWIERFDYKEAGPQLLLQAFLQRIVNGGGRIEREYGFGRGRTDLFVEYFYGDHQRQAVVLELKILRGTLETTIKEGVTQTKAYMDKCGTRHGHLLIFDRKPHRTWEEKIWQKVVEGIKIWGC
ncbi:MAG: AAA-like domain-containing protein [Bacteroidota bacterium]